MPNARQKGTKLAGAYISTEKDAALLKLAIRSGYPDKAAYLRALYDKALEDANLLPKAGGAKKAKEKDK